MAPDSRGPGAYAPSLLRGLPWILAALLMVPSLVWIYRDAGVWSFDPAWYGETSVELWYALAHNTGEWPEAMLSAFHTKAPGVSWLGQFFVPIGQSIGSIEVGLLLSVILCHFATLVLTWRFLREWIPDQLWVAVFATVATASAPLFVALSHYFLTEALQLTATTWLFWLAAAAPRMSRARQTAHLVLALSVAMLAKASSPLYFLPPLLLVLHSWIQARGWASAEDRRARLAALLVLGAMVLGAALAWYVANLKEVSAFVRAAALSETYGHAGPLQAKLLYWLRALRSNFFYPWAAAGLAVVISSGLGMRFATRARPGQATSLKYRPALAAACLLQIVMVLLAFSLNVNEDNRYLLPVLPGVVGLFGWGLANTRSRVLAIAAVSLMAVQLARVHAQALGMTERDPRIAYWLWPYQSSSAQSTELRRIIRLANEGDAADRYAIVGVDLSWLNANSLAFLAAQEKLRAHERSYFTSLGYMAADADAAWSRMQSLRTEYFVTLVAERLPPPDAFNQVSGPILERVAGDPCFESEDFASNLGIVVYHRICEWAPAQ